MKGYNNDFHDGENIPSQFAFAVKDTETKVTLITLKNREIISLFLINNLVSIRKINNYIKERALYTKLDSNGVRYE